MTGPATEPIRWSRRRWIVTVGVLLAAQVALIFYFGERSHRLPRALRLRTALHFALDDWSTERLEQLSGIVDPALFALPSQEGFSGKAWLTFARPEYKASTWSNSPVWLSLNSARLGTEFAGFVQTNALPVLASIGSWTPDFATAYIPVPPAAAAAASQLRVDGSGFPRALAAKIELRSWPQEEVLSNSVVQVLVDRAGNTISARLLDSSGSKTVDDYALQRASAARFEPAPQGAPGSAIFQRLVFQWHTIAAAQTNSLSVNR